MNERMRDKAKKIDFIVRLMRKGSFLKKDMESKFVSKFGVSVSTFRKYHADAKLKLETIESEASKEIVESVKKDLKDKVLTRAERLLIASKIARGVTRKVAGELIIPSDSERLKALDYLSKLHGEYITKVAQTDSEGNDIPMKEPMSISDLLAMDASSKN